MRCVCLCAWGRQVANEAARPASAAPLHLGEPAKAIHEYRAGGCKENHRASITCSSLPGERASGQQALKHRPPLETAIGAVTSGQGRRACALALKAIRKFEASACAITFDKCVQVWHEMRRTSVPARATGVSCIRDGSRVGGLYMWLLFGSALGLLQMRRKAAAFEHVACTRCGLGHKAAVVQGTPVARDANV
jgi:hypothetical protein